MAVSKRDRNRVMRIICDFNKTRKANEWMSHEYITRNGFPDKVKVKEIVDVLIAMGYLRLNKDVFPAGAPVIELTDKGRAYFEMQSDEFWAFIRKSVLIPIAIAIVTAIITTVIIFYTNGRLTGLKPQEHTQLVTQSGLTE